MEIKDSSLCDRSLLMCICLESGIGVLLENVGKFCCLGGMLDRDGGCDSAAMARVRCAILRVFTCYWKVFLLKLKGKLCKKLFDCET